MPSGHIKVYQFILAIITYNVFYVLADELSYTDKARKMKLHAESPVLLAESSCILHAKEFLLYFT